MAKIALKPKFAKIESSKTGYFQWNNYLTQGDFIIKKDIVKDAWKYDASEITDRIESLLIKEEDLEDYTEYHITEIHYKKCTIFVSKSGDYIFLDSQYVNSLNLQLMFQKSKHDVCTTFKRDIYILPKRQPKFFEAVSALKLVKENPF